MNDTEFLDLVMRHLDGGLDTEERHRLEQQLVAGPERQRLFAETLMQAAGMRELFRQESFRRPEARRTTSESWLTGRRSKAAALVLLGVLVGLVGSGVAWAMASSRLVMTVTDVSQLADGGFEAASGALPAGFPERTGMWSGDVVEVVDSGARQGSRRVRFVKPEADVNTPQGRAIACDLFQLIDLRGLSDAGREQSTSILELSAEFLDARPENSQPSVSFFVQLYLFRGDPTEMHRTWPLNIGDAISSGSANVTTLGASGWKRVTARSLMTAEADYAVLHVAALPNMRGAMPDQVFVDDVRLIIKTQPLLPRSEGSR